MLSIRRKINALFIPNSGQPTGPSCILLVDETGRLFFLYSRHYIKHEDGGAPVPGPEGENRAYVQFLVDVDDWRKIDGLIADIQKHLDEQHPNANAIAKKFLLGPGAGGRIQARFRGPDPAQLRELADRAMKVSGK